MKWRDIVVNEALSWLHTPYRYGACMKGRGVDCARLILTCFKKADKIPKGYEPPHQHRDWIMGKNIDPETFTRCLLLFAKRISTDLIQKGDVLSFKYIGIESHLGIVVDNENFIHAVTGKCVMIHPIKTFRKKIVAVYRAK